MTTWHSTLLSLEDNNTLHVFDNQAFCKDGMRAINCIETEDSIVEEIEAAITAHLMTHPAAVITHISVGPYDACLLFLDGRISCDHVSNATVHTSNSIVRITNVMCNINELPHVLTVMIDNQEEGFEIITEAHEVR